MTQVLVEDIAVAKSESQPIPIERRAAAGLSYKEFLTEYVRKGKPVVIEQSAPDWKAMKEWTPQFFASQFGEEIVGVTYGVKMRMSEFLEKVEASTPEKPGPYLHQLIIHRDLPALLRWLSPENRYGYPRRFCSPLMPARCRRPDGYLKLLIGGPGGKFPFMHYDSDNANAVITECYGDKAFLLFAPSDTRYLYPQSHDINVSQIDDVNKVDLNKFPQFANATPYGTVLKPGETIFIPSKWWHAARALTTSISVCTNMLDAENWSGFVDWLCRSRDARNWPLRVAARMYLTLVGGILSFVEGVQRLAPRSSVSRLLSYFMPLERDPLHMSSGHGV